MEISLIAAMSKNRVIGKDNQMPWHLPADLQHFKTLTMGKPIVMGRKTFDSIGKPLPGRRNIVITRQTDLILPGVEIFHSLTAVFESLKATPEIMVIGGETLFRQALPLAHKMYLTIIEQEFEGDTFFPEWDSGAWQEISNQTFPPDAKNPFAYCFVDLVRN